MPFFKKQDAQKSSRNKWDIDWAKFSVPRVKAVVEPKQGLGAGVGAAVLDMPRSQEHSRVKAATITHPQGPTIPAGGVPEDDINIEDCDIVSDTQIHETENIHSTDHKENQMETTNAVQAHTSNTKTQSEPAKSLQSTAKQFATNSPERNVQGGMEMLGLDFLLSIVENTTGDDPNDVAMRKMTFNELIRTNRRHEIASGALKVYAVDEEGLYGNNIQCQAMQELTQRTN